MDRRFIGSTVALTFGIFLLFAIFAPPDKNPYPVESFVIGLLIITGSLMYKSAKKRKLGIVKSTIMRQFLEILGLLIVLSLAIFRKNHLVTYIVVVLVFSLYLIMRQKKSRNDLDSANKKTSEN